MDIFSSLLYTQCAIYIVYAITQLVGTAIIYKYYDTMYGCDIKYQIEKCIMVSLFVYISTPESISQDVTIFTNKFLDYIF